MAQTQIKCQQEQLSGVLEGRETSLCCGQRIQVCLISLHLD